jgi:hypothetical protein
MQSFWEELRTQRWDDHRYYHHSRINQSCTSSARSASSVAYVMLFTDPVAAALIGWLVAMVSRQSGHFFFEPKGYDEVNQATHEYKEDDQGRLQPAPQGRLHDLGAVAARAVARSDAVSASFSRTRAARSSCATSGEIWLVLGIGGCCSAPSSCSS